jgi:hypothetical protein
LPPHLSTLLGLSQEQECLVRQGVVRTGEMLHGFDVSTANTNDVVLFIVNETTNDQTLYLTSKEGVLGKVVTVEEGVGRVQKVTGVLRKAFEKEKQFWLDRLAPVIARGIDESAVRARFSGLELTFLNRNPAGGSQSLASVVIETVSEPALNATLSVPAPDGGICIQIRPATRS